MAYTSTYMGLTIWNLLSDLFDHNALANDLVAIDGHDHTTGKGKQIPTGGIADGAVTGTKIAVASITGDRLAAGTIPGSAITAGGITGSNIANGSITYANIATFMQWVVATTSASAAVDTVVNYTGAGAGTITLPSAAANNSAIIGVRAGSTAAVTVTSSSGNIWGPGCWNVSSIKLGVPGAYALFMSDGGNWNIIAGQQDSGWVPLSLQSGISTAGSVGATASCRLFGDRVYLKGGLLNNTASPWNGTIATLPSGFRPTTLTYLPVGYNNGVTSALIQPSGTLGAFGGMIIGGAIYLDGASFTTDA